ncbi:hypothetical protein EIP86_002482 [Pleurotus ostreatoroseus]|nr:hypothetical protein EIP86_002482 [Pleurotus ostreatoroseus]
MIPTNFLARINQYLCHRYPPPLNQVHRVEKVIRVLSAKLAHCSGALVVPFVVHLQEGVVQWLQDKDHLSKQERYEEFILPFYYNVVFALHSAPLRVEDIRGLDPFLAAPFLRPKYTEKTLRCLNDYWEAIEDSWYKSVGNQPPPPGIEEWVAACHYTCHTKRPRFMADSSSSSQSETSMFLDRAPYLTLSLWKTKQRPMTCTEVRYEMNAFQLAPILRIESITPKAHKTLPASIQSNGESSHVSRVAAHTPVAPPLRAPIALASSRNTHAGPLADSSLANSTRPQQATKPASTSRKRRRADAEDKEIAMSSEDVSTKSGPARACGGRDSPVSPEQTTGERTGDRKIGYEEASIVPHTDRLDRLNGKKPEEAAANVENGLPTPPASFEQQGRIIPR